MINSLAQSEIARISWHSLREISGAAEDIPNALESLLRAPTADAVTEAYWRLENHVVVQGQLFEAAEYVVPVLIAALLDERPRHVRIGLLELLFQILAGQPHEEEIARGNEGVAARCRLKGKEGLWVLYREFQKGEREAAREVIALIEDDRQRLDFFGKRFVGE